MNKRGRKVEPTLDRHGPDPIVKVTSGYAPLTITRSHAPKGKNSYRIHSAMKPHGMQGKQDANLQREAACP